MTPEQKELLRQSALEVLVACFPVPRPLHAIRRLVNREVTFHFSDDDLSAALEFLRGMDLLTYTIDHLGSTKWWTATASGVLQVERAAPTPSSAE
jgi:hypothetical protein